MNPSTHRYQKDRLRRLGLAVLSLVLILNVAAAPAVAAQTDLPSALITPADGGTLNSPDGRVTVVFPPGMFAENTIVTYAEAPADGLPSSLAAVGPGFALRAARASDGQPVDLFAMDACPRAGDAEPTCKSDCTPLPEGGMQITIRYADADLQARGLSESELVLSYFYSPDGEHGKWLPLATGVDGAQNRAQASTWYMAHFALLGVSHPAQVMALEQADVIVDDQSGGFQRFQTGYCAAYPNHCWWDYTSATGAYSGHSYYTMNSTAARGRENWGEWTPNLPQSGQYEILAFIPWGGATTRAAHYHIYSGDSEIGTATVNQASVYADWASLGTFSLPAGSQARVYLDDLTGNQSYASEYIGFDAVKFVWRGEGPGPMPEPFSVESVAAVDGAGSPLAWDALVLASQSLVVEARAHGDNPPARLEARLRAEPSGFEAHLDLNLQGTADGVHTYRGSRSARDAVSPTTDGTVAAVVYEAEFDYGVAGQFMDNLGIPAARRRGIAWSGGDEARRRPPANLEYLKAAGYEDVTVDLPAYPSVPEDKVFVQNQADVLLYIGHGHHDVNQLFLTGVNPQDTPEHIKDAWEGRVRAVVLFACSVLDINDYNLWNLRLGYKHDASPGKAWAKVPGPQVIVGFQTPAPLLGDPSEGGQNGERAILEVASNYKPPFFSWVDAWRQATGKLPLVPLSLGGFVGGVAIDQGGGGRYYYWREYRLPLLDGQKALYTWESVPRADWDKSVQGLEALMASPAEVHVYDEQGLHVGANGQGGVDVEIPGSAYWAPEMAGEPDADARRLSIRTADLSQGYRLQLVGTGEGTFNFWLEIPDRAAGTLYEAVYGNVPVTSGAEFSLAMERGSDMALSVDADGDGVFEGQVAPTELVTSTMDLPVNLSVTGPAGDNGWYVGDVVATLSGSARQDLPALVSLEYSLGLGWLPYQAPLTLGQEGKNTLQYRGNFDGGQDVTQSVKIGIDKTRPTVTITEPTVVTQTLCSSFRVSYEAEDAVSGLASVTATFDGQEITNGQSFDALWLAPGPHEIVVTARDRAGWLTTETRTIQVVTTIEGLACAKHRFYDMGLIYGPGAEGIVKSLDAKLGAALAAERRGQLHAAANILAALVRDVNAQEGKHITPEAASFLTERAQELIDRLSE